MTAGKSRLPALKAQEYPPKDPQFNLDAPLERIYRESTRANQAIRDYAYMRSGRSLRILLARYQDMKKDWKVGQPVPPTTSWQTLIEWSSGFAWKERVGAFDAIMQREDEIAFSKEQEEWRRRRRALLRVANSKIAASLNVVKTEGVKLPELVNALERLMEQSRIEYNDTPGLEVENTPDGKMVINTVVEIPQQPPDIESLLSQKDDQPEGNISS
jgi:hypothetical protein